MDSPNLVKLTSELDASVNFIVHDNQEARYVRRTDDYFIVYLSSHNGCNKACRFCHLTQSGQTTFIESTAQEMLDQASVVMAHYVAEVESGRQAAAETVHFNWMARGEPLASTLLRNHWASLTAGLTKLALDAGVKAVRFNISTIFPLEMQDYPLHFDGAQPTVFYSLYSMNPEFRKRWLPKAMDPEVALKRLTEWQRNFNTDVVLHWALINNENDSIDDINAITETIARHGLKARFNLVRYNPFSAGQGEESSEATIEDRFTLLQKAMTVRGSRIVPRVGFDVKASCGMFVVSTK